jgi:4-carboxymuconolactone decarboxylase
MTRSRYLRRMTAFSTLTAAAVLASAQSAAKLPADLDPDSRARLPYLQRQHMDEKAQKIFDTLPGRSQEGILRGPLAFAAYNPGVAQALFALHNAAVGEGTLDAHTRELAILVACRETNYSLEWNAHSPSALKAGVDQKTIDIVRHNGPLTGVDEKDATVIRFGRQLLHDGKMDSATRRDGHGCGHEHVRRERILRDRRRRAHAAGPARSRECEPLVVAPVERATVPMPREASAGRVGHRAAGIRRESHADSQDWVLDTAFGPLDDIPIERVFCHDEPECAGWRHHIVNPARRFRPHPDVADRGFAQRTDLELKAVDRAERKGAHPR